MIIKRGKLKEWTRKMKECKMKSCLLSEKLYCLHNPLTINYNNVRDNHSSVVWINLIVGSYALHNVTKAYENVVNSIATFVQSTPPTNIITNETNLTQYSIKQGLKKNLGCSTKNNCSSFITPYLSSQKILNTSATNNKETAWHI